VSALSTNAGHRAGRVDEREETAVGIYVITTACIDVKDRSCVAACPVDCIYEGVRSLYIHPEECVECGACESVCPVEAIWPLDILPDELSAFAEDNRRFFSESGLGSPKGAAGVGPVDYDTALVRRGGIDATGQP
jgi:NAD-dependent dihydropyrimidine dehydrogenase PreA subunit